MINFPAFCPACGLIFNSGIAMGNVQGFTISGSHSRCPRCGAWGDIPDGTFNVTEDTIEVLSAPELTRERLRRLATIFEANRAGTISDEQAAEAVANVAPPLSALVNRFGPRMQRALLVFLWAVVQILLAQALAEHRDHAPSKADVQHAVEEAIHQCLRTSP